MICIELRFSLYYFCFCFNELYITFCVSTSKYILEFTCNLVDLYYLFVDILPKQWRMETLAQLEALCERLYNSQDSVERAHAESTLKCFSSNADYISQCQYVLDNASSPYALMLASSSLLKQVTEQSLPLQLRIDIRNVLACLQMIITWEYFKGYILLSLVCGKNVLFVHLPWQILLSAVSS